MVRERPNIVPTPSFQVLLELWEAREPVLKQEKDDERPVPSKHILIEESAEEESEEEHVELVKHGLSVVSDDDEGSVKEPEKEPETEVLAQQQETPISAPSSTTITPYCDGVLPRGKRALTSAFFPAAKKQEKDNKQEKDSKQEKDKKKEKEAALWGDEGKDEKPALTMPPIEKTAAAATAAPPLQTRSAVKPSPVKKEEPVAEIEDFTTPWSASGFLARPALLERGMTVEVLDFETRTEQTPTYNYGKIHSVQDYKDAAGTYNRKIILEFQKFRGSREEVELELRLPAPIADLARPKTFLKWTERSRGNVTWLQAG